jgi:REP element-mobilizing transposase RayT
MNSNVTDTWFLTWTTYATWLPGDRRGFVGAVRETSSRLKVRRKEFGIPYEAAAPELEAFAQSRLRGEPIWLRAELAEVVAGQIEATAAHRCWRLLALAVMRNHVHVVVNVPGEYDPESVLRDLKAYASRALNDRFGKPSGGTWWTRSGSKRLCLDEAAVAARVRYVRCQASPLVVRDYVTAG